VITTRGWTVVGAAVLFALVARLLGIRELYGLAAAAGALVLAAMLYVRSSRFSLEAIRDLRPPRVHAGMGSRVELSVRNTSNRRSPVLSARDPFDGGRRWARFLLAPLAPGEVARAAYRLPTDDRGVFDLGPLDVQLSESTRSRPCRWPRATTPTRGRTRPPPSPGRARTSTRCGSTRRATTCAGCTGPARPSSTS
jgi:uncharacterized protein (DUF58 family)